MKAPLPKAIPPKRSGDSEFTEQMKLPLTADTPLNPKLKITSTTGLVEIK